jgi:hypothetical protein
MNSQQVFKVLVFVLVLITVTLVWKGLPDATPSRLRQQCSDQLREIVHPILLNALSSTQESAEKSNERQTRFRGSITSQGLDDLRKYLRELKCPGATEVHSADLSYIVAPAIWKQIDIDDDATILACDRPGNHPTSEGEWVNFLLANGKVVCVIVDGDQFKNWIQTSFIRDSTPRVFPPDGLSVE